MKANNLKTGYTTMAVSCIFAALGLIGFGLLTLQNIALNNLYALLYSWLIVGGLACLLIGAIIALASLPSFWSKKQESKQK